MLIIRNTLRCKVFRIENTDDSIPCEINAIVSIFVKLFT